MIKYTSDIQFHFLKTCRLQSRLQLKDFIRLIFKKEKSELDSLTIVFCDDEYLLDLNRKFLNHDYYTDILSFPLSKTNSPLIAEIYISIDRVRDNARAHSYSVEMELHRVIFHGVLHFCGFKDKTKAQKDKMRDLEDKYLKAYFKGNSSIG